MKGSDWKSRQILICLLVAILVLVVYWPVRDYGFINYDDPLYVSENIQVQAGLTLDGFIWALTDISSSNWHPLTWLSHMLDWQLFRDQAGGHHWTNVIFHLINTLLLFTLLRTMTGAVWRSACVTFLFAIHPMQVESVAWISERKNLLSAGLGITTLLFYMHYLEQPSWRRYWPVITAFALGLMAKPMLVTLPFLLFLIDYWPLRRFPGVAVAGETPENPRTRFQQGQEKVSLSWLLLEKIPLILLSAASIAITLISAERGGAIKSLAYFPLWIRLSNSLQAYMAYIERLVWPHDLAVFYPHPGSSLLGWTVVAAVLMAAVTLLVVVKGRRYPYLLTGWFWFVGTLVPVIGIVQVGLQAMADRYIYFPCIGLFILLVWGVADLCLRRRILRPAMVLGFVFLVVCAGLVTHRQLGYWQSSTTLFTRTVSVTRENDIAHNNLAHALFREGDAEGAISHYREAIRINPRYANAYNNLGTVLARLGRFGEAILQYQKALTIEPRHVGARFNLGLAMESLGRYAEADDCYGVLLRETPDHIYALRQRGMIALAEERYEEAASHFRAALRLLPKDQGLQAVLRQAVEGRPFPQKELDRKMY